MHVRFERSDGAMEAAGDAASSLVSHLIVGPYEWVQVTYSELRVAPDGDVVAYSDEGRWYLIDRDSGGRGALDARLHATKAERENFFSDFVVY